jgi:branched-chain amino acid aminotransferase
MNAFVFWKSLQNPHKRQLITPPLDGTILPGVMRDSILNLCRQWGEFDVLEASITIHELIAALNEKRLLEVFGSGTAAIIAPVKNVRFRGVDYSIPLDPDNPNEGAGPLARRLWREIVKIQYGDVAHEWSVLVD